MKGIIVTGTDTDAGKTIFSAALLAATGGTYWKPVQAGLEGETDSMLVARLSGNAGSILPEEYRLKTPASPHFAAQIDDVEIDLAKLDLPDSEPIREPLIIEGAGGVLVPLSRSRLQVDLFARWGLPAVVVASTQLGTINHTLLTIEALKRRAIPILGVAFSGEANEDSEQTICRIGNVARLGRLPIVEPLDAATLLAAFHENFSAGDFL